MKKPRCYKKEGEEVASAVFLCNLIDEGHGGSGTLDAIDEGNRVIGGYVVKKKFYENKKSITIGWGAALSNKEFCIYLKPQFRKKGLGSRIIKRAKKDFPKHHFCPWNEETLSFFEKRKVKITSEYL